MNAALKNLLLLFVLFSPFFVNAELLVGIGKTEITPPIGTPSAGYTERQGAGMTGIHDPLQAIALVISNGEKTIALCSVDNLGFTHEMVERITQQVQSSLGLSHCEVYVGSSHTHSGGGAFLNTPKVGELLAGPYQPLIVKYYEDQTAKAIIQASQNQIPAKIGIGYGKAENLSQYRGLWPIGVIPLPDLTIIKVTKLDGTPFAVLFNYPVHPTVLNNKNRLFSADFVGYARNEIQSLIGHGIQPIYFNGAQGDIIPLISNEEERFESCHILGQSLAEAVDRVWKTTDVSATLQIATYKDSYEFKPQPTPQGLILPIETYKTEMNLLVFNQRHAFITIPGELSTLYDRRLKEIGRKMGYQQVSFFGLTNDAHGYIILPESWQKKTYESNLSFGGEHYGELINQKAQVLLLRAINKEENR